MSDMWSWLRKLLGPEPDFVGVQPSMAVKISSDEVFNILNKILPQSDHIYLSDNEYYLCSAKDIENFLAQDGTNKFKYDAEIFDCDDFSYRLMGQMSIPNWSACAFGIVWTDLHALNLFIDEQKKLWYVEPQSDKIEITLESWQGTAASLIVF